MILDVNVNVDINSLVDKLIKIGQPLAAHGWEIYVRQQVIEGYVGLIWPAILLITLVGFFVALKMSNRKVYKNRSGILCDAWDSTSVPTAGVMTILLGLIVIVSLLATAVTIQDTIGRLLNPEYYAIQAVLGR